LTVALCATSLFARDALYLELSAHGDRLDLGLADFGTQRAKVEEAQLARQIRDVAQQDLLFPRIFNIVEGGAAPVKNEVPFESWRELGCDVLVTGKVNTGWFRSNQFEFTGVLYDVVSMNVILQKKYSADVTDYRRVAHEWADEIVGYFLGTKGISRSKIAFVNDSTGKKEVYCIDYDGANLRRLTSDRSTALFPKLSPDGNSIVFMSYRDGTPKLYLMSSEGGQRRVLCGYDGLNSSAAFAPDGQSLVATLSLGRDPNLYLVDLNGKIIRPLTRSFAVDTAPSFAPDGTHVAFTSDRPGYPQVYSMDINGANLKVMTFGGQCDSPAWSPIGDVIAFTMSEFGGRYDIYLVDVASGYQKRLTWGEGNNENPAWSPDGRYIVFTSTRRGRSELFVMGADGSNPRPLADIPGRSFTPSWGL